MSDTHTPTTPLRRTSRVLKPSLKAVESESVSKLKISGFVHTFTSSDEEPQFSDEDQETPEKPKLLHEDEAIKGKDMFTFKKTKQRESLAMKIQEALVKTPQVVRSKMKNKLKTVFEDSGSEYEVSEEESSSCNSDNSSESSEEEIKKVKPKGEVMKFDNVKTTTRGRIIKPNSKYTIDTEEYFANSGSSKIKTSNNTLDKLETPRLPQYELQKLLSNKQFSSEHSVAIKNLTMSYEKNFIKWLYVLKQNFSVLLYGLGSKKNILSSFHTEYLQDDPVVVVNGFFPSLTVKNILDNIIQDLLEMKECPSSLNDATDLIIHETKSRGIYIYLLINNIEALRTTKGQKTLATLGNSPNIHLIATIDHINAPLIWDHNTLSKFNFTWWDVTSFRTYQHETECEMSSMTQQNSALALSSLRNVFLSLTQNSKAIYLKVAKHQLEHSGQYYQGMAFKDLYMACREGFIVSSDLALRAQLSEFIDHKMVKSRRSTEDGTEYLVIPLNNAVLAQFIEEN
ncbi:origin recognition complex subunit 2 [Euwallacea fornicatus]|uniref:origin recognition complex subunit 2 n=1 Tax=Euwallacea fornicatus TaxID=995702 RepID=UPI00338DD005